MTVTNPGTSGNCQTFANGNVRSSAAEYLGFGVLPIPVQYRGKKPWDHTTNKLRFEWEKLRPTAADLDRLFPPRTPSNIGLLLGEPSKGLIDIDLDTPQAVAAAGVLLPPTGWVSGRAGSPRSHYFYRVASPPKKASEAYKDLDNSTKLLELRSSGGQTVVPPSIWQDEDNPSRTEQVIWYVFEHPAHIDFVELIVAVRSVAAAALLARYWPKKGSLHDARVALSGALTRGGWEVERVARFVTAVTVAAGNQGLRDAAAVAESTAERLRQGKTTWGWTKLEELLGEEHGTAVVGRVRGWLGATGGGASTAPAAPEEWEPAVPLGGGNVAPPPFPVDVLPDWQAAWVEATACATQTPPDLAGMLSLAICGAAVARKYRVLVRPGWAEPVNIMNVVTLLPGERKSAVFNAALAPVQEYERQKQEEERPKLAEAACNRRMKEGRRKALEDKAAKAAKVEDAQKWKDEARQLARELATEEVPEPTQCYCDDVTPEKLAGMIADQQGRMLQASAEGTAFEIVKGRYSESPNFDVYLKGHAGDPIKTNRQGREGESVEQPALSLALAVQPDVIHGLTEKTGLKGRGFLARLLFSLPCSRVGNRQVGAPPVPEDVRQEYHKRLKALWELPWKEEEHGKLVPTWVEFSAPADRVMAEFERWLEPHLAEGKDLSFLAGWANKLAGAVARIAAILHLAGGESGWITRETAEAAVRLGRDYLLPHAQIAFNQMGADPRLDDARRVVRWLGHSVDSVKSVKGGPPSSVTRRDIHAHVWGGSRKAEDLDPVLELLVRYNYLRPVEEQGNRKGPGRKPSPRYEVNLAAVAQFCRGPPLSQNSQNSQNGPPV
jgi:hypothetical protein